LGEHRQENKNLKSNNNYGKTISPPATVTINISLFTLFLHFLRFKKPCRIQISLICDGLICDYNIQLIDGFDIARSNSIE